MQMMALVTGILIQKKLDLNQSLAIKYLQFAAPCGAEILSRRILKILVNCIESHLTPLYLLGNGLQLFSEDIVGKACWNIYQYLYRDGILNLVTSADAFN